MVRLSLFLIFNVFLFHKATFLEWFQWKWKDLLRLFTFLCKTFSILSHVKKLRKIVEMFL